MYDSQRIADRAKRFLIRKGYVRPRRPPQGDYTCAVLQTRSEVEEGVREAERLGLPWYGQKEKFWDALSAVRTIVKNVPRSEWILDGGAELYSPVLPWLVCYGYRKLVACNPVFEKQIHRGPIVYEPGDITASPYEANKFAAVTCMSVMEHGVDPAAFFRECKRIVKPNGYVILSVDYWPTPIDTKGKQAFGVTIKFFTREDIEMFVRLARNEGFELVAPLNLSAKETTVAWEGFDFTFIVLTFQKKT